ncbi:MAG: hypothetical protein IJT49_00995 [Clostridia bacterium]|nr:hypothetical protein [Clostridia bacterium]
MKKAFAGIITVVLSVVLCLSASAAVNSNHLIDEGFPRFNGDESEWDVFGWTVVDTKVVAMGYKLDGGDIVWADESVDVRETAAKVEPNDCFEDLELDRAIIDMSLSNGLENFYGYRIHITLDTSNMAKGEHQLEVVVKYEDGTEGNPFRESVIQITKTKAAVNGGEQNNGENKADDPAKEDPQTVNPGTADAAVIAAAAVAAIALAGVVTAKKIQRGK